jgi:hypothetical protein
MSVSLGDYLAVSRMSVETSHFWLEDPLAIHEGIEELKRVLKKVLKRM